MLEAIKVFPHSTEMIYSMFDQAVTQECKWTDHIMDNNILGITSDSTEQYTKYLANLRLKTIGLKPLYLDEKYKVNPYKHLDKISDVEAEGHSKSNFFESTVTQYVMSSGVSGWEDW